MFFSTEALGSILGVYGPTSNLTERTCHRRPFPTHSSVNMHKLLHLHANIAKNLILGYLGASTPVKLPNLCQSLWLPSCNICDLKIVPIDVFRREESKWTIKVYIEEKKCTRWYTTGGHRTHNRWSPYSPPVVTVLTTGGLTPYSDTYSPQTAHRACACTRALEKWKQPIGRFCNQLVVFFFLPIGCYNRQLVVC